MLLVNISKKLKQNVTTCLHFVKWNFRRSEFMMKHRLVDAIYFLLVGQSKKKKHAKILFIYLCHAINHIRFSCLQIFRLAFSFYYFMFFFSLYPITMLLSFLHAMETCPNEKKLVKWQGKMCVGYVCGKNDENILNYSQCGSKICFSHAGHVCCFWLEHNLNSRFIIYESKSQMMKPKKPSTCHWSPFRNFLL